MDKTHSENARRLAVLMTRYRRSVAQEIVMSSSIHHSHFAVSPRPTLRLFRARNAVFFWSDVIDTA